MIIIVRVSVVLSLCVYVHAFVRGWV